MKPPIILLPASDTVARAAEIPATTQLDQQVTAQFMDAYMRQRQVIVPWSSNQKTADARGYRMTCGRCGKRQVVPMGWMSDPMPEGEPIKALRCFAAEGWTVEQLHDIAMCGECNNAGKRRN